MTKEDLKKIQDEIKRQQLKDIAINVINRSLPEGYKLTYLEITFESESGDNIETFKHKKTN